MGMGMWMGAGAGRQEWFVPRICRILLHLATLQDRNGGVRGGTPRGALHLQLRVTFRRGNFKGKRTLKGKRPYNGVRVGIGRDGGAGRDMGAGGGQDIRVRGGGATVGGAGAARRGGGGLGGIRGTRAADTVHPHTCLPRDECCNVPQCSPRSIQLHRPLLRESRLLSEMGRI